jgi:hypothetical protein
METNVKKHINFRSILALGRFIEMARIEKRNSRQERAMQISKVRIEMLAYANQLS